MDEPQPRNSPPVLDYGTEEKTSPMRALGRIAIPLLGILGLALIALGIIDRSYQGLATAGSVLVGSILIATSLRERR